MLYKQQPRPLTSLSTILSPSLVSVHFRAKPRHPNFTLGPLWGSSMCLYTGNVARFRILWRAGAW